MENLTFIIVAIIFGFVFFGPHNKSKKPKKKKDDKEDEEKKK